MEEERFIHFVFKCLLSSDEDFTFYICWFPWSQFEYCIFSVNSEDSEMICKEKGNGICGFIIYNS